MSAPASKKCEGVCKDDNHYSRMHFFHGAQFESTRSYLLDTTEDKNYNFESTRVPSLFA
jgi:hypothetical protein